MPKWISDNLALIVAGAINLMALGGVYTSMRMSIAANTARIEKLESLRADQTGWTVAQHEKRLDSHDAALLKIGEKIDKLTVMVERIDQKLTTAK